MEIDIKPVRRFIGKILSPIKNILNNGYINNDDGKAKCGRNILPENFCVNLMSTLFAGVFFTGLVLFGFHREVQQ